MSREELQKLREDLNLSLSIELPRYLKINSFFSFPDDKVLLICSICAVFTFPKGKNALGVARL
jgi:hypothetical protein